MFSAHGARKGYMNENHKTAKEELRKWYDGDRDPAHIEQAEYFFDKAIEELAASRVAPMLSDGVKRKVKKMVKPEFEETVIKKMSPRVGALVRWDRETSKKLSLRYVAKKMGISAAYLSDLELGRRLFSDKLLKKYNAVR